ncbi:MAG: MotA/TolQ/ExbB proton channel family protein, partial [Alistipes sp.]|nr:MotA/TolQ/ExbB proton channel family protein [Alistipes sp.]
MKKLFLVLAAATLSFGAAFAQDATETPAQEVAVEEAAPVAEVEAVEELAGEPMHFALMKKFLEGGWEWMLPVLVCLVLGLAIAIERILYLTFA